MVSCASMHDDHMSEILNEITLRLVVRLHEMTRELVLPWLSQCFCHKMGTVFQIKLLKFRGYSRVWKGPKAERHVLALKNWIVRSWVIQMALIWLMAWLQIKAM